MNAIQIAEIIGTAIGTVLAFIYFFSITSMCSIFVWHTATLIQPKIKLLSVRKQIAISYGLTLLSLPICKYMAPIINGWF